MIAGSVTLMWFLDVSYASCGVRKIYGIRSFLLRETSVSSVSLWFIPENHHGDTENTEVSQRTRLDTLITGLLKYAVFFCAKFESVYIQRSCFE